MILELPQALQRPLKNIVALQNFEGPLDLLLYLIEKEEFAIEEIALIEITKPYLEVIRTLQYANGERWELDGEFFVIAATLVLIKSRRLLPPSRIEGLVEEALVENDQDPTLSLIEQLVQYKKFKDRSKVLFDCITYEQSKIARFFLRSQIESEMNPSKHCLAPISPRRLKGLWDKMQLRLQQKKLFEHFGEEFITVSEQMEWLLQRLKLNSRLVFQNLWDGSEAHQPIFATFLATLELTRQQKTMMHQANNFDHLWVQLSEESA